MAEPGWRTPGTLGGEGFFRALVENAADPFIVVDGDLKVAYASPHAERLLGFSPEDLVGKNALDLLAEDSRDLAVDAIATLLPSTADGGRPNKPVRLVAKRADGTEAPLSVLAARWPDERVGGLVLQVSDAGHAQAMSDTVNAILEGSDRDRVLRLLASIIEYDISGSSACLAGGWNGRGFTRVAGHCGPLDLRSPLPFDRVAISAALAGPDEVCDLFPHLAPETRAAAEKVGRRGCWLAQVRVGDERDLAAALIVWHPAPGPPGPVYRQDICRAVRVVQLGLRWELQQRMLSWDASHDPLTRLVNRVELQDRLEVQPGRRAVLYCDLDDFKPINDTHGHRYGDAVLMAVARRLEATARPHLAARLGGDEFAVVMDDITDSDDAIRLARRLIEVVTQPIDALGVNIEVGLSIGVAVDMTGRADGDTVLHAADVALRTAKASGKGRVACSISEEGSPVAPLHR